MSIILVGMPATGKTTIANELEKHGYTRYLTYTTRPPRPGEILGEDYYFWDEDLFLSEKKKGFFLETKSYEVANGDTWYYGSTSAFLRNSNGVIILDPTGIEAVHEYLKKHPKTKKPCVVYLDGDDDVIADRMLLRGDDPKEISRRIASDRQRFDNFYQRLQDSFEWPTRTFAFFNCNIDYIVDEIAHCMPSQK